MTGLTIYSKIKNHNFLLIEQKLLMLVVGELEEMTKVVRYDFCFLFLLSAYTFYYLYHF